jgi:hypothetical protein
MSDPAKNASYRTQPELMRAADLFSPTPLPFRTVSEQRAQVLKEDMEREAERQVRLSSQTSPMRPPEERIRIWEQLHGLSLPRAATHKLVGIIAQQTDLSVAEVLAEQTRRSQPPVTTAAT